MSAILDYYGLRSQPFPQRLNDANKRYETNDLKQTNAVLRYALPEMGISLICGDTGRGVSYAVYCATESLSRANYNVRCMPVCHICPRDFYKEACRVVGTPSFGRSRQAMITALRQGALELKKQGKPLVLVLDNAQNLPELVLWDLVTLVSGDFGLENLMMLILCGTKELKYRIQQTENQNLEENLVAHYTLKGLSQQETPAYVLDRLTMAGGKRDMVSEDVLNALYEISCRGSIRELNNVMRTALLVGAQADRPVIDMAVLRSAVEHRKL